MKILPGKSVGWLHISFLFSHQSHSHRLINIPVKEHLLRSFFSFWSHLQCITKIFSFNCPFSLTTPYPNLQHYQTFPEISTVELIKKKGNLTKNLHHFLLSDKSKSSFSYLVLQKKICFCIPPPALSYLLWVTQTLLSQVPLTTCFIQVPNPSRYPY